MAIVELVRGTAELVGRTLYQEVVVDLPADERACQALVVEADANQLQQALVNLALNARDALLARQAQAGSSPASTEPIVFRLRPAVLTSEQPGFPQPVPPGDYVVIEVEDRGAGMTADVLNQALDPFFTTKEVGQGTGLGLPMVFGIVQAHQGYLTLDSDPRRGTRVSLYLPRAVPAADAVPPSRLGEAEGGEPETAPNRAILVIDDEEAVRDVVRRFLRIAGHVVTCVASGQEALERLNSGHPCDLIILDLMIPREDALTTFQLLRQRHPDVPVLLCTGLPQTDPAPEMLRNGAAGIIRKPFRMSELWHAVKQALLAK
jgi:two-component system cell cycle sensor histidine kinase/response regulator CckA